MVSGRRIKAILIDQGIFNQNSEVEMIQHICDSCIVFNSQKRLCIPIEVIFMLNNQIRYDLSAFMQEVKSRLPAINWTEMAVISNDIELLTLFMQYRIFTINYWSMENNQMFDYGRLPDVRVNGIDEMIQCLHAGFKGYVAEVLSDPMINIKDMFPCIALFISDRVDFRLPYIIGGRYFTHRDSRHFQHPLSVRLYQSKSNPQLEQAPFLGIYNVLLKCAIDLFKVQWDTILSIPPRPNCTDRFFFYVEELAKMHNLDSLKGSFVCSKMYQTQKGLNQEMRRCNIRGAFQCLTDISGRNIILIDDILTTGATSEEAVRTLYAAGAAQVIVLVLAANQFPDNTNLDTKLVCPSCPDGELKLIDGQYGLFWGCTNYNDYVTKCGTFSYGVGEEFLRRKINLSLDNKFSNV